MGADLTSAGTALPRVLVLMATYNGAPWVEEQLRSIFAQEDVQTTLVVRDDASVDDTAAIVRSVCSAHDGTVIERAVSSSGSAASNFFALMSMVDASDQDFVALSDQDDVWEPGKLARAAACLAQSGAEAYSAAVRAFWPDGRTAVLAQTAAQTQADYLFEGGGQGCTFVMRASFFARIQRTLRSQTQCLQPLHYHDWALYALCRLDDGRWFRDEWIGVNYRQHGTNDTGARSGIAGLRKRVTKIRSGWYGAQILAIVRLCVAVKGDRATPALRYLRCREAARCSIMGRLVLVRFVWRHGRRRFLDRIVLAWAALSGHLTC